MHGFRVTIVDDRKSVLQETEIQLNAIEKPSLQSPSSSLNENIFHIYGILFSTMKKKEIKNSRYVQAITNCGVRRRRKCTNLVGWKKKRKKENFSF